MFGPLPAVMQFGKLIRFSEKVAQSHHDDTVDGDSNQPVKDHEDPRESRRWSQVSITFFHKYSINHWGKICKSYFDSNKSFQSLLQKSSWRILTGSKRKKTSIPPGHHE